VSLPPPSCRHFGVCGGCTALSTPIEEQLAHKKAQVTAALQPFLAGANIDVAPPPRTPSYDRMKLLYPAQPDAAGALATGLYAAGTHTLVPITECSIQARALTLLAQRVTEILRSHGVSAYDERAQRGCLRALHARIAPGTGELLVGLVTHERELPHAATLVPQLVDACSDLPRATREPVRLVGLVHNVHERPSNFLLGPTTHTLWGRDFLRDRADGLTFKVSFASFYQVHRHASAVLYRPALAMLGDVRGQRVLDGYGGVGTFALRLLAAGAAHVDLVEANASAGADATDAAAWNNLAERMRVHVLPVADAEVPRPNAAVLDPPRAGLGEAGVARVLQLAPARMLYVSCALSALARDLAGLVPAYRVTAARVCDLFPHTQHVEVVLLLRRA
jgi:23S rRNA (uracil1939-C5)-methyltransferase